MTLIHQESQPLPIHIAQRWNFELTYYVKDQEYLYSIKDWLSGLGISSNRGRADIMQRLTSEVELHPLPIQTTTGEKTSNFTNDEGLYRLAQEMRSTKKRPQLKEIKDYLAKAGVLVDQIRQASSQHQLRREKQWDKLGRDDLWKQNRRDSILSFKEFTSMLHDAIDDLEAKHYGQATNAVYRGLFDRKANDLKQQAGTKDLRDRLPRESLTYITLVQDYVKSALQGRENVTYKEALSIIENICNQLKPIIEAHQRMKGIDLGTGNPLLPE